MALPRIILRGRTVILLSGFRREVEHVGDLVRKVSVQAEEKLHVSMKREPDAVAFGYVGGRWIAAA